MIEDLATVFSTELRLRVKSRPFLIGLLIGVFGIFMIAKLPSFVGNAFNGSNAIVLAGDPAIVTRAKPLLASDFHVVAVLPAQSATAATLREHHAAAVFVFAQGPRGLALTIYAHDPGSMQTDQIRRDLLPLQLQLVTRRSAADVVRLTAIPVDLKTIGSKFASSEEAGAARGVAYTLIFFLYILIMINSQLVTSSVAAEKTSRIAELLIAAVDPTALLGGKILAGAVLALLQMILWVGAGVLFGSQATSTGTPDSANLLSLTGIMSVISPGVLIAFLLFFVIGFLQLSTVFAAFASLINRTEDLGSITGPLVIPVIAALFIAIGALGSPDAPFAVIFSFVPLLSPFVMFARIAVSNVPFWQLSLSLAINLAALYLIAVFAGKLYRVGLLLYGKPPKLGQILNVIRN